MAPPGGPNESIVVLVGMCGVGKSGMGREAARLIRSEFIDLEEVTARVSGARWPQEIVREKGLDAFHKLELVALSQALAGKHAQHRPAVLACGGALVEAPRGAELLQQHWPVVYIDRHIEDILRFDYDCDGNRDSTVGAEAVSFAQPPEEHPSETYRRHAPLYQRCADFVFPVERGIADVSLLGRTFGRLLRHIIGGGGVYLGADTFSVPLSLPEVEMASPELLRVLETGADVLELRVDLLTSSQDHERVAQQVAMLRRRTNGAPLLFTVRSRDHGGGFAGSEDEYFALLRLGLRLGCELVDIECTWAEERIDEIVRQRCSTLLVGSFHEIRRTPSAEELASLFRRCSLGGSAAIAKVVIKCSSREDNWHIQEVGARAVLPGVSHIGICLGDEGRLSRVLSSVLCPVTHPRLPNAAAPGLLSIDHVLTYRRSLSLQGPARQFPVLGPFGAEELRLMPVLHGEAFAKLGLPHVCRAEPVDTLEEARRVLSLASVGGAAAAGMLREALIDLLGNNRCSEAACAAGAVDTVVRLEDGCLYGENSECAAIRTRLEAMGFLTGAASRSGLVLGGGATGRAALRALQDLNFGRAIVKGGFGRRAQLSEDLAAALDLPRLDVIILAELPELLGGAGAGRVLSALLLPAIERLRPVVVETAWPPRAPPHGAATGGEPLPSIVEGARTACGDDRVVLAAELLLEQACVRNELWTGRPAPRLRVARTLLREVARVQEPPALLLREAEPAGGEAEEPEESLWSPTRVEYTSSGHDHSDALSPRPDGHGQLQL